MHTYIHTYTVHTYILMEPYTKVDPAARNNGNAVSSISRNDQWEAWREIQLQYDQVQNEMTP